MKKDLVKKDLRTSTNSLLDVLSVIPKEIFNEHPYRGGWTVGKVGEHLIKVETGTVRLFTGPSKASERDAGEKIEHIRSRMMDFETKMTAYGPIIPNDEQKDKTKVLEKLQDIRQQLLGFIDIQDLTKMITGFEHPIFGPLTRVEWIYFNIYHSRRHVKQIEKIHWELQGLNK